MWGIACKKTGLRNPHAENFWNHQNILKTAFVLLLCWFIEVPCRPRFTWNTVSLLLRPLHGSKVAWNLVCTLGNNSLHGLNRVEWPLFHKDRWHNHKRQKIIGECLIHYGKGLWTSAWYLSDFSHLRRGSNVEPWAENALLTTMLWWFTQPAMSTLELVKNGGDDVLLTMFSIHSIFSILT